MATKTRKNKNSKTTVRFIGKPTGQIQERVQKVGPQHFGIVSVDCAKRRSKWMLCDFYGRVLVEPTVVEHTRSGLDMMTQSITIARQTHHLKDLIVAVEMTGIYHRPVQRACRDAGFETRLVHPFASKHFHKPLHTDDKTDDHDLEAIFHAVAQGYGLEIKPLDEIYLSLQLLTRHRSRLVKQKARLQIQIRQLMHQSMPGYADLFEDDNFFNKSIAISVAKKFSSAKEIHDAGVKGISAYLKKNKIRFQAPTVEKIVAWASNAADAAPLGKMLTMQWLELNDLRFQMMENVVRIEREMAGFLAKTPYVLLLSVTGINVVSAGALAGEAGPLNRYANSRSMIGRAGLFPSRYQSDEVDRPNGKLVRQGNKRLRVALLTIAENLIKCHSYYRGYSALLTQQKVHPRDRRCRVANKASRMIFQIVGGRQVWRGKGVDREYLLYKLKEFHRTHRSPATQTVGDLNEAFKWLPKSSYREEAEQLSVAAGKRRRGVTSLGDLLIPLLIRLGVPASDEVDSSSSEARDSH